MPSRLSSALVILLGLSQSPPPPQEWQVTGGDPGATRHSPLTQITKDNVARLDQAWSFDTGANNLQVTPIVAGGVMYLTAASTVFAIAPETGKELWRFAAPGKVSRRGVAYWPGDGTRQPRLYSGIEGGRLVALDARTGEPLTEFGKSGFVDLKAGLGDAEGSFMLDSPAAVYKNVLITGGSNSEGEPSRGLYGDIRGWDARDGRLLWTFHTVPRAGEKGVETWDGESWRNRSGVNAWTYITVDAERGLVFAATGAPTSDFYGGDRRGDNLYANSVVALDAATGALKWFRQLVHHDLWDWDLPAPPALIEVVRNGRRIPAVAQMTKMSLVFVFDRVTGEPIFGLEERPVPPSVVPGEAASPTQPFPLRPAPLSRTSFDPARDMYSLTPEHAAYCRDLWAKHNMVAAPIFSPPGLTATMVMFPSTLGGGNWSGFSYDPVRRRLFTNIMNLAQVARMERREPPVEGRVPYRRTSPWGSPYGRFWDPQTKVPCSAPPFGELVALDADTAEIAWRVPLGVFDDLKARGFPSTGAPNIGGTISTATGILFIAGTIDARFRAFDADNGKLLWDTQLPASGHATPLTYAGRDGRQYVVIAAGGDGLLQSPVGSKVVAFALPAGALYFHPQPPTPKMNVPEQSLWELGVGRWELTEPSDAAARLISAMRLTLAASLFVLLSLAPACRKPPSPEQAHPLPADHVQQVEQWRAKHEADYRRDWVSIAGLHPLKQGSNTAGTAPGNDIRLTGALPPELGTFTLQGQEVRFAPAAGANVTLKGGEPVTSPIVLEDDSTTTPDELLVGDVRLVIHRSGDTRSLRVRDPSGPLARGFLGFQWFAIEARHRAVGRFIRDAAAKSLQVMNTYGDVDTYKSEGVIEFTLEGRRLTLRPFTTRPNRFYIVFRDASSGSETYEAARFLYADLLEDGTTVLDFNEAYNPPCAFNPYTTCPIPIPENRIPVKVLAGEKAYPVQVDLPMKNPTGH